MSPRIIKMDEVEYVRKEDVQQEVRNTEVVDTEGLKYVLVRTYSAGVHIGYLEHFEGMQVTLIKSRRIWSWVGALSCSELATCGPSEPKKCKLSEEVPEITLTQAIEIIPIQNKAFNIYKGIAPWSN